jgi:hypothetical protein
MKIFKNKKRIWLTGERGIFSDNQIKKIEELKDAKFLWENSILDKNGNWTNFPCAIFWTKIAHPKGSNFFAMYRNGIAGINPIMIANGITGINPIRGILIDNDIIYSRYVHDYFPYKGVVVDGGREYFRYGGERLSEARFVKLCIVASLTVSPQYCNSEYKVDWEDEGSVMPWGEYNDSSIAPIMEENNGSE